MLPLALEFPNAVVRLPAQLPDAVGELLDHLPELGRDEPALALVNRHAVDHRPEDIALPLAGGPVADPYRTGADGAGPVVAALIRPVRVPGHPADAFQRTVLVT